jgi:uncharacterized protein (TIGR00290 family)
MKAYMNWSGGKDSSLALYHALQNKEHDVDVLFTNVNAVHNRISMHGVRRELLQLQAASIGLPLYTAELPEQPSMADYEEEMKERVNGLKKRSYTAAVFGDIFLEDLRKYREEQLAKLNIDCVFPLWKRDTKELMQEFLQLGFKAIIVCVNANLLDQSFCGRVIDESFVEALPENVDTCGENGEYHSFVFDGPIFKQPVPIKIGEKVFKEYNVPKAEKDNCFTTQLPSSMGFWFCDLLPA